MLPLTAFDEPTDRRSDPDTPPELPAATGTPRAFTRWWPRLLTAGGLLALAAAPAAAWAARQLAGPLGLADTAAAAAGPGAAVAAAAGMLTAPGEASRWGPAGVGVTRAGAVTGVAALLWVAAVGGAALVLVEVLRRRHRDGAAHPWQLTGLRTRQIIRSAAHTRPLLGPMLPRRVKAARRLGLHQYGPRIGVLRDIWRLELRARHEDSTIAVAPPRGHKTAAVVIPRVLDAPGAVLVTSTKADVLLTTAPAAPRWAPCGCWTPRGSPNPCRRPGRG